MGYRHDLEKSRFTKRRQGFDIAIEHRLERLLGFPIRMLRASALTRSIANMIWKYIGCSAHKVPSWSKVAMRSSGFDIIGPAFAGYTVDKVDYRFYWRRRSKKAADRVPRR